MRRQVALQIRDEEYILGQRTWIVGILNVTPDSFSDGNLYFETEKAVQHGLDLIKEGADILDIGAESSRPGSDPIPAEEELRRLLPVLKEIRSRTDTLISIDTTKAEVAAKAFAAGADIINDISALRFDKNMLPLAVETGAPVILMHMKGQPKTMQANPNYDDLLEEIHCFFRERIEAATAKGVHRDKIILDPGIGFGKSLSDNLSLIRNLSFFEDLGHPILMGLSRKTFIGKIVNGTPQDRLEGSLAAAVLSLANGAHMLRVHDVAATKKAVLVADILLDTESRMDAPIGDLRKKHHYVF